MFNLLNAVVGGAHPASRLSRVRELSQIGVIVANTLIGISFGVSTIAIAYAFVQFITAQGDPKKMDTARKSLTYAVVAMFISIGAIALRLVFANTFGTTATEITEEPTGF